MSRKRYARILTIAGSDSGGGAGIQADLKTFAALGCFGMSAITAITAQNTMGVTAIHGLAPDMVGAQIDAVFDDIGADSVKIGMLHAPDLVRMVAAKLRQWQPKTIILDPVMVATSGARLIEPETIDVLIHELFPLASLVTPNLDELILLSGGTTIATVAEMTIAAQSLLDKGCKGVLAKGGHLNGSVLTDLYVTAQATIRMDAPRIDSHNLHGTGCTLSSAIAAFCGLGLPLEAAIVEARAFITRAIAEGADVTTGKGHGPLNHGFAPVPMRKFDV